LPIATQILMTISDMAVRFWPAIIFLSLFGFWGFKTYRKTTVGRHVTDGIILKIPIIGELQRGMLISELTRTMGLMVGSGVSILESLSITAGVVGNVIISDALKDVAKQVEKGFPIAYSFARHPEAFPFILSQMIAVGEETGKMEEILAKVSHVFEVEADQKVKALTAAIEPLIMVVLGLGVTFLVVAIILPIYTLTTTL
jgi:type IV pilus assembly protein PilC